MQLAKIFTERRVFVLAVLLTQTVAFSAMAADSGSNPGSKPPAVRRPSIILIVADGLGPGDLGCYGQGKILTPFIDKMAGEGMLFRQFYGGASEGAASRAALLTGESSGHGNVRGEGKGALGASERTMGEVLRADGYSTAIFGEWGLGGQPDGDLPVQRGFDEWFGYLHQADADEYFPLYLHRADKDFDKFPDHNKFHEITANKNAARGKYADDFFTETAKNFIRVTKPEAFNLYKPFFLELNYNIPRANRSLAAQTGNGMETPDDKPYTDQPWPQPEKNRAAMISRLDRYVGALMEYLVSQKIDGNTLVVFTSSTGPQKSGGVDPAFFNSAGSLRGLQGDVYEGGIRVPLIAWWNGRIKPGAVSDLPAANYDLLPTLAEAAGAKIPKGIDGVSFLPTLVAQPQTARHDYLYWESHYKGFHQAVRAGQWKGVRHGVDAPVEVYDLKVDPYETKDVAAANPGVVAKLSAFLGEARTPDANWPALTAAETKVIGAAKP